VFVFDPPTLSRAEEDEGKALEEEEGGEPKLCVVERLWMSLARRLWRRGWADSSPGGGLPEHCARMASGAEPRLATLPRFFAH